PRARDALDPPYVCRRQPRLSQARAARRDRRVQALGPPAADPSGPGGQRAGRGGLTVVTTSLVARVRDLVARATIRPLEPAEIAEHAADLGELRTRLDRLAALGYGDAVALAPEVEALLAKAPTAAV